MALSVAGERLDLEARVLPGRKAGSRGRKFEILTEASCMRGVFAGCSLCLVPHVRRVGLFQ